MAVLVLTPKSPAELRFMEMHNLNKQAHHALNLYKKELGFCFDCMDKNASKPVLAPGPDDEDYKALKHLEQELDGIRIRLKEITVAVRSPTLVTNDEIFSVVEKCDAMKQADPMPPAYVHPQSIPSEANV